MGACRTTFPPSTKPVLKTGAERSQWRTYQARKAGYDGGPLDVVELSSTFSVMNRCRNAGAAMSSCNS